MSKFLGYCKECGEPIYDSYACLPDYPKCYECLKCFYPNCR